MTLRKSRNTLKPNATQSSFFMKPSISTVSRNKPVKELNFYEIMSKHFSKKENKSSIINETNNNSFYNMTFNKTKIKNSFNLSNTNSIKCTPVKIPWGRSRHSQFASTDIHMYMDKE